MVLPSGCYGVFCERFSSVLSYLRYEQNDVYQMQLGPFVRKGQYLYQYPTY